MPRILLYGAEFCGIVAAYLDNYPTRPFAASTSKLHRKTVIFCRLFLRFCGLKSQLPRWPSFRKSLFLQNAVFHVASTLRPSAETFASSLYGARNLNTCALSRLFQAMLLQSRNSH